MACWWTVDIKRRIMMLAAPFGLGPRIAANTLADELSLNCRPWKYSAFRPRLDSPLRVILNFGVTEHWVDSIEAAKRVWIDCLLWLRRKLPPVVRSYDLVLAEAFFPTLEELEGTGPILLSVAPLLRLAAPLSAIPTKLLSPSEGLILHLPPTPTDS